MIKLISFIILFILFACLCIFAYEDGTVSGDLSRQVGWNWGIIISSVCIFILLFINSREVHLLSFVITASGLAILTGSTYGLGVNANNPDSSMYQGCIVGAIIGTFIAGIGAGSIFGDEIKKASETVSDAIKTN